MRNHFLPLLAMLIFAYIGVSAQNPDGNNFNSYYTDPMVNSIPPTPNASGFIEYGSIPVNTSKGLTNISIPIYTLEVDGVQIPISVDYIPTGVKVDDISSTVGLKWTLNAGGGVFRTVNDLDDLAGGLGWINNTSISHFDEWVNGHPNYDYSLPDHQLYGIGRDVTNMDNWPDDFSYNFLNMSGEFKFKPDGTLVKGIEDNLVIQPHNIETSNLNYSYFSVKDAVGNEFLFSNNINNKDLSHTAYQYLNYTEGSASTLTDRSSHIVGWLLDDIDTRNGFNINFEYENTQNGVPDYYTYTQTINPISQKIIYAMGCGLDEGCVAGKTVPLDCLLEKNDYQRHYSFHGTSMQYISQNSLIKKISSQNVDVQFLYAEGNIIDGNTTTVISGWKKRINQIIITDKLQNKVKKFHFKYGVFKGDPRLKLTEIYEEGFDGSLKPSYKFTYDEVNSLPDVGSKSKDYEGYYNGKANVSLMPISERALIQQLGNFNSKLSDRYFDLDYLTTGILTDIEYPTGGKTHFEYEPNAIGENQTEPLVENFEIMLNTGTEFGPWNEVDPEALDYYVFSTLVRLDNLSNQIHFWVNPQTYCPACDDEGLSFELPILRLYDFNGSLNDPITLSRRGEFRAGNSLHNREGDLQVSIYNPLESGVYLLQLKVRKSTYNLNDPNSTFINVHLYSARKRTDVNGNVLYQQNYFGGLRIKEVKDIDKDNAIYNEKIFNYKDFFIDETNVYTNQVRNFKKYNWDQNGQVIFNSDLMPLYEYYPTIDGYTYTKVEVENKNQNVYGKTVDEYKPNKIFNSINGGDIISNKIYDKDENILSNIDYDYYEEEKDEFIFKVPSLMNLSVAYQDICWFAGQIVGTMTIMRSGFSSDIRNFGHKSFKKYMSSKKSTNFFTVGNDIEPITVVNDFEYNDDMLVTKETTNTKYLASLNGSGDIEYNPLGDPNGKIIEVNYEYPKDVYPIPNVPFGLAISKKVTNNTAPIFGQYYDYDIRGNIKNIYLYNKGEGTHSGGPGYVPQDYEQDVSYLTDLGKPTQVKGQDGVITSYIWGYNNQYPVAQIVGLSYDIIPSATIIQIQNLSVAIPYNETTLITALNGLRTSFPNAKITTYTHSTLVGTSTITDPKGIQIDYIYDNFGRLKYVKDQEDNILGKNEYHYKN